MESKYRPFIKRNITFDIRTSNPSEDHVTFRALLHDRGMQMWVHSGGATKKQSDAKVFLLSRFSKKPGEIPRVVPPELVP